MVPGQFATLDLVAIINLAFTPLQVMKPAGDDGKRETIALCDMMMIPVTKASAAEEVRIGKDIGCHKGWP